MIEKKIVFKKDFTCYCQKSDQEAVGDYKKQLFIIKSAPLSYIYDFSFLISTIVVYWLIRQWILFT